MNSCWMGLELKQQPWWLGSARHNWCLDREEHVVRHDLGSIIREELHGGKDKGRTWMYMLCYESQPKAWAEYRYKAKLIQGCVGGRPIWAILGRWRPELGAGTLKQGLGIPSLFWSLKEKKWGKPDPHIFFKKCEVRLGLFFFFF